MADVFLGIVILILSGTYWYQRYKKNILKPTPRPNRIPYDSDGFRR